MIVSPVKIIGCEIIHAGTWICRICGLVTPPGVPSLNHRHRKSDSGVHQNKLNEILVYADCSDHSIPLSHSKITRSSILNARNWCLLWVPIKRAIS